MKKHGFTLIELLVVISIIGILASLLLVSYQGAKKTARDGRRKADWEQLRSALEIYKSDQGKYYDPTPNDPKDLPTFFLNSDGSDDLQKELITKGYLSNPISDPVGLDNSAACSKCANLGTKPCPLKYYYRHYGDNNDMYPNYRGRYVFFVNLEDQPEPTKVWNCASNCWMGGGCGSGLDCFTPADQYAFNYLICPP